MPANLENSAVATGLEKVSFYSNPKKRQCQRMFKLHQNWVHFTCSSARLCSKSFKLGSNGTWAENFQMFKLALEKAEEPEIKLPTSIRQSKKQKSSNKTSALLTRAKPLTMWITTNCGKFFKRWEYQTTWPAFWEICMQVRKQQLELDMEQQTGSK